MSPPSASNPQVMQAIKQVSIAMWPDVPVNAAMSAGYTDSRWLRNAGIPAYGVSGLFSDPGNNGVHGKNEQIGAKALLDGKEFLDRLVRTLAGGS
jgi:acetylornithine deacetylase/succinyl-diaminopimelate desuccinylase-like protein